MVENTYEIVIRDCVILTMDANFSTIHQGSIGIADGTIQEIARHPSQLNGEIVIDGRNKIAMPGLVNTHTHVAMTIFRGLAEDIPLNSWLEEVIWPRERKLTAEDVFNGSLLGCAELISSGCTCFNDHYFFMEKVAEAVKISGLRSVLAETLIESTSDDPEALLRKGLDFAVKYDGYADGRVLTALGPHSEYSCTPDFLSNVSESGRQNCLRIHMHLAESRTYATQVREKHGLTPVKLMEKIGILGPRLIAAHCIHVDADEIQMLADRGVKVSHNPVSNMKVALGVAPVLAMLRAGVTVGLGTDGPASNNNLDLLKDMKFASLLQKQASGNPTALPAKALLKMTTIDGARVLGLEDKIGSIEKGKLADVILLDLSRPHLTPFHDPYAMVAYSALGGDVDTVIIGGKIVMEARRIKSFDAKTAQEKASEAAASIA